MTKQEWREKAKEVKSDTIKSIIDDLLSHEARRNPFMPQKREITIPWDEVEVHLVGLLEIDDKLSEQKARIDGELGRQREARSFSKGIFEG